MQRIVSSDTICARKLWCTRTETAKRVEQMHERKFALRKASGISWPSCDCGYRRDRVSLNHRRRQSRCCLTSSGLSETTSQWQTSRRSSQRSKVAFTALYHGCVDASTDLNRKRALVIRESWVALMEARITREALQKCWRESGCVPSCVCKRHADTGSRVNHYQECGELAEKYQQMIRDNRVCSCSPSDEYR